MPEKNLIPIIAIVVTSLACSVFQLATPEAPSATQTPIQADVEPAQAAAEAPAEAESAPAEESEEPAAQDEAPQQAQDSAQTESVQPLPDGFSYPIVDTGQVYCYSDSGSISCPTEDQPFYGQDAQYSGNAPNYTDNGDGTITDNVTGLMWQQDPGAKMTYAQAVAGAESLNLAGHDDWRLPTIKELYSLILFSGVNPSGLQSSSDTSELIPFIDDVFAFEYGDTNAGERIIDSQFASSTKYVSTTMRGDETDFGVNFADGRIKGYGLSAPGGGGEKTFFVLYVRGNPDYGINDFVDNGDGTISDNATGLTWTQDDSGAGLNWEEALNYCESLETAGVKDWRTPNVKELQSILDYSRSPDTANSAAIDSLFNVSTITNESGTTDYPFYWSSTTHANMRSGGNAAYVSFGRAMGYMNDQWMDVHGAGAQRSDPKSGDPAEWPTGHGPQGDAIRIYNYVRCVTGGASSEIITGGEIDPNIGAGAELPGNGTGQGQNPGGQSGSPPQEAINACSGLSAGAACSFNAPLIGTVNGSCTQLQTQALSILACVPQP